MAHTAGYVMPPDGLILRAGPDISSAKISVMGRGEPVMILEKVEPPVRINGIEGRWLKVRYREKEGWAFGGYIGDSPPAGENTTDPVFGPKSYVTLRAGDIIPGQVPSGISGATFMARDEHVYCRSEGEVSTAKLSFNNGRIQYLWKGNRGYDQVEAKHTGGYEVRGDRLIVMLDEGEEIVTKDCCSPASQKIKGKAKAQVITLRWIVKLGGFLPEERIGAYSGSEVLHNDREHYIITRDNEASRLRCGAGSAESNNFSLVGYYHRL